MEVIDNVISAYEAVKMNGVSQGIIALCSFIAVIIVIQKFVTAWKEAFSEGDKPVDMKQFFKLFYIYIYVFAIIMVAPFAFTIVETALGNLQNELISHYQEDVDLSIDEAIVTFTKDYIEDVQRRHNWVGSRFRRLSCCRSILRLIRYSCTQRNIYFSSLRQPGICILYSWRSSRR